MRTEGSDAVAEFQKTHAEKTCTFAASKVREHACSFLCTETFVVQKKLNLSMHGKGAIVGSLQVFKISIRSIDVQSEVRNSRNVGTLLKWFQEGNWGQLKEVYL